ncbi:SDR family NAD(P)-dependent oxidoreductase [Rhizobium sp. CECT 9324]|uniref:SDR family NAD(P)-dependent oxidoreductase n=1 Tax=Rhizobium sp. CECT 9324 TaxID=2845820 RepID=UPI001E3FCFA8|nr:SDR family NAD(P)-dependent oxidoreductase [Rhizobium sp. CECT 9324]CAH0343467.1 Dihydroanticapsin 7-dehydrogenase [Rhizobium sp. CECT 9324]
MRKPTCVIVTGAAGNLGRATAARLASEGVNLVCVDRTTEALDALVQSLPPEAKVLTFAGADLGDPVAAQAMVEAAVDRFGGIDALVNTVGGFATGPVGRDVFAQWDLMMKLNAQVALVTSIAVLPVMQAARYGRIVHIAAAPGLKAGANQAAYAASKAAVLRLTESIAAEHRVNRITANCILPGTIDTPQNRAAMPDAKVSDWVSPEPIARLIAFLISPEAAVVSGAAIPATGLE